MQATPKALVIDDSALIRHTVKEILGDFNVDVAANGKIGLDMAIAGTYDILVCDVEMPEMDGLTLCRELKQIPSKKSTPVVILSHLSESEDVEKGFMAGADAYVAKTEVRQQLVETIKGLLVGKGFFSHHQTVLLAEDNRTIQTILMEGLGGAGYKVELAANGQEAIHLIDKDRPNLVITDIEMPVMNGMELTRAIRARQELATLPIVVMSGHQDKKVMREMFALGVSSYIVKPFNIEQLLMTAERMLEHQHQLLLLERQRLKAEREAVLASIASLAEALEARDVYTRGHSDAVASISVQIGARLGLDDKKLHDLELGGKLHDIGKIGIPDHVLHKPGRLNEEEWGIIKSHPLVGYRIMSQAPPLKRLLDMVKHHHERFDGKGYPDGLSGEDIPLEARAMAVADTFHALISDRPYREGMNKPQAIEVIKEVSGTQLCPKCVNAFLDWVKNDQRW